MGRAWGTNVGIWMSPPPGVGWAALATHSPCAENNVSLAVISITCSDVAVRDIFVYLDVWHRVCVQLFLFQIVV